MSEIVCSEPVLKNGVSFSPTREKKGIGPIEKTSQASSKIFVEKTEPKTATKKTNYVYISVFLGVTALVAVAAILYLRGERFKAALQEEQETTKKLSSSERDLRDKLEKAETSESSYKKLYQGTLAQFKNKSADYSSLQRDLQQRNSELNSLRSERNNALNERDNALNERNNALTERNLAVEDKNLAIQCATLRRNSMKSWEQDDRVPDDTDGLRARCQELLFLSNQKN